MKWKFHWEALDDCSLLDSSNISVGSTGWDYTKYPTDGVMKEISRESGKNRGIRHALTVEQQRAFMEYIANHPIYYHWWPMFTVLLGTGCRIGEALGLRWQDLDYDRRTISINHSLSYYQKPESNKSVLRISKPKTKLEYVQFQCWTL